MKAQTIAYICNHRDGRVKIFMEEPASPMWESAELVSRHDADAELETLKAENARLTDALQWEQNRADRIGTHGDGCWKWGPSHYECALREIDRLTARLEPDYSVDDSLTARRIFALMGYAERSPSLDPGADPLRDKVAAVIGTRVETARAAPLAPPKVLQADEVTEPGWYWWRKGGGYEWFPKQLDWFYVERMNKSVLIFWHYLGTDEQNLYSEFIGPIPYPDADHADG